jgi:hypothetical protein
MSTAHTSPEPTATVPSALKKLTPISPAEFHDQMGVAPADKFNGLKHVSPPPKEGVINTSTTVCAAGLEKTDETYSPTNGEFMLAVFGPLDANALNPPRPVMVSFKGSPGTAPKNTWFGKAWNGQAAAADALYPGANNYTSMATYWPDEAGRTRRLKQNFVALYAVMLDDIGTKVPHERLRLQPSWLLETSAHNYQAGYFLDVPLTNPLEADQLVEALIAAGLSDPGANGPCSRLMRLPVAVNAKSTPPFACRMATWSPQLRYSVAELRSGFELAAVSAVSAVSESRQAKRPAPKAQQSADGSDPVWIPRPEQNTVLAALRSHGQYKADLGNGKHDITCPWVKEHTGEVDGGTAYFEPDDNWPIGGFKCLHGHCAHRHVRELLDFVGVDVAAARMKPTIRAVTGELHRVVDAAEHELARTQLHYQRGGLIVTIVTDPGTRETRVQDINASALLRALAGIATWERFDMRSKEWVRVDPSPRYTNVLYDSTSYQHLPVLRGLARQPYLRPDGSLMQTPGYDSATGMFGVFEQGEFSVPELPTLADAQAALRVLKEPLTEFSFARDADRSTALAAILTAAARSSLSHAPMAHVRAPMVGSGKSYLCELITAFATPQRGTPTTFPADDEECRKLLLAELLRGPAVIEFDNLTSDLLAHKSLCTALTSEFVSGRILGVSKTATVNTRTLFLSSGNNVGPVHDMARRCITIHLDPGCEVPAARTFSRPDLVREVLNQRGRYVSAALTILRAWVVAGRPQSQCKSLAGFGDWSDLCRQPLLWLGLPDPAESVFQAMAEDPNRETLGRLLTAWQDVYGNTPAMVRDAVNAAMKFSSEYQELREVLRDIADERGEINRRKLGWWIKRHAGRIVDGRRFVRSSSNRSAETWQVQTLTTATAVTTDGFEVPTGCVSSDESVVSVSSVLIQPIGETGNAKTSRNGYARASRGD